MYVQIATSFRKSDIEYIYVHIFYYYFVFKKIRDFRLFELASIAALWSVHLIQEG